MRIRLLNTDGNQHLTFRNDDQTAAVNAVRFNGDTFTYSHSVSDHAAKGDDQTIYCYRQAAVVLDLTGADVEA